MDGNVIITGFDGVPEWATEKTVNDMLANISELVSLTKKQTRDITSGLKSVGKASGSGTKTSGKGSAKETEGMLSALTSGLKSSTKGALDSAAGFDKLPASLSGFAKALKNTSGATKLMALGVGMIANQAGKAIATIQSTVGTLREMADSGLQFQGSFLEVQENLSKSGMTIADFSEVVGKYSQVITQQGLGTITDLANKVNAAGDGFAKWGLTSAEGIDVAADLMDRRRKAGLFEQISAAQQAKVVEDVMDRMTAYSKVLNVSRKTMMEGTKALLSDSEVRFRASQMDVKSRAKFEKGISALATSATSLGPEFGEIQEGLKQFAVQSADVQSEMYQKWAASGGAEFADKMRDMGNAVAEGKEVTPEELAQAAIRAASNKGYMESLHMAGGSSRDFAIMLGGASLKAEEYLAQKAKMEKDGTDKTAKSVDGNVRTMAKLETSIQKLMATKEYLRTQMFVDLLGGAGPDAIGAMITAIDLMRGKMYDFAKSGITADFREMVVDNPIAAAGAVIAAYVALKGATLAVSASLLKVGPGLLKFGGLLGKVGAVGAAGAAGYAVGTALNALPTLFGFDSISTNIGDGFDRMMGRNQDMSIASTPEGRMAQLDPAQQEVLKLSRERRAQLKQKESSTASQIAAPATIQDDAMSQTSVEPTMSSADIAKLKGVDRTNYLLEENIKYSKKIAIAIGGDVI